MPKRIRRPYRPKGIPRYRFSVVKFERWRKRADLSKTLVGAYLELSPNAVVRWLNMRSQPNIGNLKRIALLLGCEMEDLVELDKD